MVGESNRDRAYLMALGAWKDFGHSQEDAYAFARRIATIGETQGLASAAEAVAEDCRAHGLQMSQKRVLKGLGGWLDAGHAVLPRLGAIEELHLEDLDRRMPPGLAQVFGKTEELPRRGDLDLRLRGLEPSRDTTGQPPVRPLSRVLIWVILAAVVALVWWLFFS